MGNGISSTKYCPYVCLLKQLLKAGGAKASESHILELLQIVEKYCSWFPAIGNLELGDWERVAKEF